MKRILVILLTALIIQCFAKIDFSEPEIIHDNSYSLSNALESDFDNDGDNDLVTTSRGKVFFMENLSGDGLEIKKRLIKSFSYMGIIYDLADLNNDNINEVVYFTDEFFGVLSYNSEINDFEDIEIDNESDADDFKILDFNQDGNLDVIYREDYEIKIKFGSGNFQDWTTEIVATAAEDFESLDVYDLDNDGNLDFVGCTENEIYLSRNSGNSIDFINTTILETDAYPIIIEDFNNDSQIDILISSGQHKILTNLFSEEIITQELEIESEHLSCFDMDNDGDLDLINLGVEYLWGDNDLILYSNNSSTIFSFDESLIHEGYRANAIATDFDSDGDKDIVTIILDPERVVILENENNSYTLNTLFEYDITSLTDIHFDICDLNDDNQIDLIINCFNFVDGNKYRIYINDSEGSFTKSDFSNIIYSSTELNAGFITQDNETDVIQFDQEKRKIILFDNYNSNKSYIADEDQEVIFSYIADFNGDNLNDIFYKTENQAFIITNEIPTTGKFSDKTLVYEHVNEDCDPTFLDYDNDGDLDIFDQITNSELNLFTNNGNIEFSHSTFFSENQVFHFFDVIDFDFDGDLDVVTSNNDNFEINLYSNNNDSFTSTNLHTFDNFNFDINFEVVDVDNDGDYDIFGKCPVFYFIENHNNELYEHRFVNITFILFNLNVEVIDIDGDGDLDLVQAGYYGAQTRYSGIYYHEQIDGLNHFSDRNFLHSYSWNGDHLDQSVFFMNNDVLEIYFHNAYDITIKSFNAIDDPYFINPVNNLTALVNDDSNIELSWSLDSINESSLNDLISHKIYRDDVEIGEVDAEQTSFIDSDVDFGNHEYYVISNYGVQDSYPSLPIEVNFYHLPEPINLNAELIGNDVHLSWEIQDQNLNVLGYKIYKNESLLDSVNVTEYVDLDIEQGEHSYFIKTIYENGESDPSEIVTINFVENETNETPIKTNLLGNYPNPFNPTTNINYSVGRTENVNLSIYNVKGQLIKILVNEKQESDNYQVEWNGEDSSNNQVSSGIYFYKLQVGSKQITKKMILMK